jgi:hypothetical protein
VNESLVSVTPPDGYESRTFQMNLGPATEQDVINALETTARLNNGKFPEDLSMMSQMGMVKEMALAQNDPAKRKAAEAKMAEGITAISRAWMFINDPRIGDDFHYAGKNVPSGQAGTPILWYRPKDSETYRVIDADLTVRDVAPADLPSVPSTVLKPMSAPAEAQPQQQ